MKDNQNPESSSVRASSEAGIARWVSIEDPGSFLPGCSMPIHVSESGEKYRFAFRTHDPWPTGKLSRRQQQRLLTDIVPVLNGLHALHQKRLFYGRISDKTFCHRGDGSTPLIMVDPRLVTNVAEVTGGHHEEKYWLADRIRDRRDARAIDDLYALGVVLAEVLLQPQRVDTIWNGLADKKQFAEKLVENLRCLSANQQLQRLTKWLLQSPDHPNRTAAGAIDYLNGVQRAISIGVKVVVAAAVLAVGLLAVHLERNKTEHEKQRGDKLQANVAELEDDVKRRDLKIAELKAITLPPPNPPNPPNPVAIRIWKDEIAGGTLDETIQSANRYLDDHPAGDQRKLIEEWRDKLVKLRDGSSHLSEWFKADSELRKSLLSAIYEPSQDHSAVTHRASELNQAYTTWTGWAESEKSFADVSAEQARIGSTPKGTILGEWLNEVANLSALEFEIARGATSNPWSTPHLMSIEAGGVAAYKEWSWKTSSASGNSITMSLTGYKSGDPVNISLEQHGYVWNPNVLHWKYEGPLAPWKLGVWRRIAFPPDTGYSLSIRQTVPVRPPHLSARKPGEAPPVKSAPKVDDADAAKKPEYDPKDHIPFNAAKTRP